MTSLDAHGSAVRTSDGPNVVALGGGHGLAASLQAVRRYAGHVTAIVSVADDGGSSGRLRAALGIPAPGDLRRCLVALGDPDSVWARAFEHRFTEGDLDGHSLGNLIIAGLAASTGDFGRALEEAGRLVGAVGEVLPATTDPVVLKAEVRGGRPVHGQVQVSSAARPISRVSLVPPDAEPPRRALEAIAAADQIVIGPGSLYSSVLAVVAVPAIRDALATSSTTSSSTSSTTSRALKVYVCNLGPERHESEELDAAAHLQALRDHGVEVDVMIYDPARMALGYVSGVEVVERALATPDGYAHDPVRLAVALAERLA
jgi:uncharacterized cofD-like protein